MFNKIKSGISKVCSKVKSAFTTTESAVVAKVHEVLDGTAAEAYVDTGVKILIGVIIGALVLGGLYTLFNTTIMPTVTTKITELFNYKG